MKYLEGKTGEISTAERNWNIQNFLTQHPISNSHLWLTLLSKQKPSLLQSFVQVNIMGRRDNGYITQDDVIPIIEKYQALSEFGPVSIAELTRNSESTSLMQKTFFQHVSFNYDLEQIASEYEGDKIEGLDYTGSALLDQIRNVDFAMLRRKKFIGEEEMRYSRATEAPETVIDFTLGGLFFAKSVMEKYINQLFPLLEPHQIMIARRTGDMNALPRIGQKWL